MPTQPWPQIAIVDDDEKIPPALASLLRSSGFEAVCFWSGSDLLAYPGFASLAAVLSDIQMPHMSGLELAREIQAKTPDLPVILMTGNVDVAATATASQSGANSILKKPIIFEELLYALRSVLTNPN